MSLRTMDFDAVAAAAPLNREAAVARDSSGDLWDVEVPPDRAHWKAPPPPTHPRPWNIETDLTGQQHGRLKVVRFHGLSGISKPVPVWLVRCQCGDYEVRRHAKLLRGLGADACCFVCERVKSLRKRASKPSTRKSRAQSAAMLDKLAKGARP